MPFIIETSGTSDAVYRAGYKDDDYLNLYRIDLHDSSYLSKGSGFCYDKRLKIHSIYEGGKENLVKIEKKEDAKDFFIMKCSTHTCEMKIANISEDRFKCFVFHKYSRNLKVFNFKIQKKESYENLYKKLVKISNKIHEQYLKKNPGTILVKKPR